jgi:anion-transporting  ArsA/GET3 family ATPase
MIKDYNNVSGKQTIVDPNFNAGMTFLLVLALLAIKQLWGKFVDRVWKKAVDTEYVTIDKCKENRDQIKLDVDTKISSSNKEIIGKIEALHKSVEDQMGTLKENIENQTDGIDSLKGSVTIAILENSSMSSEKKQEAIINLTSKRGKQ